MSSREYNPCGRNDDDRDHPTPYAKDASDNDNALNDVRLTKWHSNNAGFMEVHTNKELSSNCVNWN